MQSYGNTSVSTGIPTVSAAIINLRLHHVVEANALLCRALSLLDEPVSWTWKFTSNCMAVISCSGVGVVKLVSNHKEDYT